MAASRRAVALLAGLAMGGLWGAAAPTAAAEEGPWREQNPCLTGKLPAQDYSRCLFDATQSTDRAMTAAFEAAMAVVEGRTDLAGVQRARWKSQLDEAQLRFVLFRNFDCQSVAPFEGQRGIGNFEQRALCLIENNLRRERDLRARYRPPPQVATRALDPGAAQAPHPATWTAPAAPVLD